MSRLIKPAVAAMATAFALLGPHRDLSAADYIYLTPDIGDYLWLVDEYMPTSRYGKNFATGALVDADFFGGFADLDGDGVDELLITIDHPIACDGDLCDLFIFTFDWEMTSLSVPCNWLSADRSRTLIRRSMYERFAVVAERTVVMTEISNAFTRSPPSKFEGRFDGRLWYDFFVEMYDTTIEWNEIRLSDIRLGTYDVNGDGRDEVFIYAVSPAMCGRDECGGAILELLPTEVGSTPGWRWIGELLGLDVADNLIIGEDISSSPARRMKVLNKVIDGYHSLCSRRSSLSWNGETYDISFRYGCGLD